MLKYVRRVFCNKKKSKSSENEYCELSEDNSCVSTKDPFESMSEELHDLVLQHLNAKASEVCLSWCDHIFNSKVCMKNIRVRLRNDFNEIGAEKQDEVIDILKNSSRKYQNIVVEQCDDATLEKCLQLIKHYESNWISIKLSWLTCSDLIEIPDITLPNLEVLEIIIVPDVLFIKILKSTKKLKKIVMYAGCTPDQRPDIIEGLERNKDLEDLTLLCHIFDCVFLKDVTKILKFKLKKLTIGSSNEFSKIVELNLTNFLKTQSDCLQYISIDYVNASVVNFVFREMRIRTINLRWFSNLLEYSLTENPSIITIKLPYLEDKESFKKILLASPNCEELYCKVITRTLLDFVMINMKHLRVLSSNDAIKEELIDYMETITNPNANKNIKMFAKALL